MSLTQIQEKRRKAHELLERARKVKNDAYASDKGFDAEAEQEFDNRMAEFDALLADIQRDEAFEERQRKVTGWGESESLGATASEETTPAADPSSTRTPEVNLSEATTRWMKFGPRGLKPEERSALKPGKTSVEDADEGDLGAGSSITIPFDVLGRELARQREEQRAMSVGTATAGQEFVPEGFWPALTEALLFFGGMAEAARVITTPTGNDLPFPAFDDTGNAGALLAENTQDSEQDITTSETVLNAYKYTSKIIRVSKELEQDSFFAVSPWIGSALGTRLGRIRNTHATTGTGSSQPNGVVTAASDSTVTTTNGTTFATRANILDTIDSVDMAYRRGPRVFHMFSPDSLTRVRKMEDANNLPLYQLNPRAGAPPMIEGYPYIVNPDVADLASTAKFWLFGDFSYYIIRMVLGVTLVRLVERYADFHQIGYVAIMRFDSDLVDGGGGAIKWMDAGV